jgi:hypothetical protein
MTNAATLIELGGAPSWGDINQDLCEKYRSLRLLSGKFSDHKRRFVEQLSTEDRLLINLSDEPEQISFVAARQFLTSGSCEALRGQLSFYSRFRLLVRVANPPFSSSIVGVDAVIALASRDIDCFDAHFAGVTAHLSRSSISDPSVRVLSNLLRSIALRDRQDDTIAQADEFLRSKQNVFDTALISVLRALVVQDEAKIAQGYEAVLKSHRRSNWLSARAPVNRYLPVLPIGLLVLIEKFSKVMLPSPTASVEKYINFLRENQDRPGASTFYYSDEIAFLNYMIANPANAKAGLSARLRRAWAVA